MRPDETQGDLVGPKLESALERFVDVLGVSAPRQFAIVCRMQLLYLGSSVRLLSIIL